MADDLKSGLENFKVLMEFKSKHSTETDKHNK